MFVLDDPPPKKIQKISSRERFDEQQDDENNEDREFNLSMYPYISHRPVIEIVLMCLNSMLVGQIKQRSKTQRFRTDQLDRENGICFPFYIIQIR